jgi:branched-chain amino acid transport system ATP-binding protein
MTVDENIQMGAFARRDKASVQEDLSAIYDAFPELKPLRRRSASLLSGGERQMVAMARALMSQPRYMLLDEPSMGLAPGMATFVFDAIPRMTRDRGVGCLLVEQNARQALSIADRACVLRLGQVVLDAPAADVDWERDLEPIYFG